jgi:hypothetical protein
VEPAKVALGVGICPQEKVIGIFPGAHYHVKIPVFEI